MHPNEELLRNGYEAFAKGDLETIRNLFADDIQWHVPGKNSISGDYKGKDEVFGFFAKLLTITEGTFAIDVHEVLANDEHAIVLTTTTARRGERSFQGRGVAAYHARNGQVTEAWFFSGDQYAEDEFYA